VRGELRAFCKIGYRTIHPVYFLYLDALPLSGMERLIVALYPDSKNGLRWLGGLHTRNSFGSTRFSRRYIDKCVGV